MTDLCIHDLDVDACAVCLGSFRYGAEPMRPLSAAIEARYEGTCAECNEDILSGDLIARSQRDTWIHVEHFDNLTVAR